MTAKPALRPFLPADTAGLADIFCAAIEELTREDYSEAQRAAWIAVADDTETFRAKLASGLTLVATMAGEPVGFATLKGADAIDMLYVRPDHAREGVATTLIDALEKLAFARGAGKLTVDASDTAKAFFLGRGYAPRTRSVASLGEEWLANTSMTKEAAAGDPPTKTLQ
jgi:putative acetyltransferase